MVQISLTMPDVLFKRSEKYSKKRGYPNLQEFIRDAVRRHLEFQRLRKIEDEMDKGINTYGPMSIEEFEREMDKL